MKFDAIRRYRAQVEDVLRMDLLQARQNLQEVENLCLALEAQTQESSAQYSSKVSAGMALEEFVEWQTTFDAEAALLTQARQTEGRLRGVWTQKQQDLREAMQERRTLDRLAERVRLQEQAARDRVEQMQMDEAARRTGATGGLRNSL